MCLPLGRVTHISYEWYIIYIYVCEVSTIICVCVYRRVVRHTYHMNDIYIYIYMYVRCQRSYVCVFTVGSSRSHVDDIHLYVCEVSKVICV